MAYKLTEKMTSCIIWICKMIEPTFDGKKNLTEKELLMIIQDYNMAKRFISQNIDDAKAMYGKPTLAMKRTIDRIFKELDIKPYINKEAIYDSFDLAMQFIGDHITELKRNHDKVSDLEAFVFNKLKNGETNIQYVSKYDEDDDYDYHWGIYDSPSSNLQSDSELKMDYERYLHDCALNDAEDGEHGCGIASRYCNYENELSFEDYKRGKRLKGYGGY